MVQPTVGFRVGSDIEFGPALIGDLFQKPVEVLTS